MAIATHIVHKTLNPIFNRKYETGKFKRLTTPTMICRFFIFPVAKWAVSNGLYSVSHKERIIANCTNSTEYCGTSTNHIDSINEYSPI